MSTEPWPAPCVVVGFLQTVLMPMGGRGVQVRAGVKMARLGGESLLCAMKGTFVGAKPGTNGAGGQGTSSRSFDDA